MRDFYTKSLHTKLRRAKVVAGLVVGALALSGLGVGILSNQANAAQRKVGITPAQVTSVVKAAVAARPGLIEELEVERKNGRIVCEIDIITPDGGSYEVTVDVETNKVLKVER